MRDQRSSQNEGGKGHITIQKDMRQVVVLEPAGSVLVIRQTSLGPSAVTSVTTTTNNTSIGGCVTTGNHHHHNAHDSHHTVLSNNVTNDHNQNRIVVVRSSSTSCMTTVSYPFCFMASLMFRVILSPIIIRK